MIDKDYDSYCLVCDVCGESAEEVFDDFYEAVDYKRDCSWKSIKVNGEWLDVCPKCYKIKKS